MAVRHALILFSCVCASVAQVTPTPTSTMMVFSSNASNSLSIQLSATTASSSPVNSHAAGLNGTAIHNGVLAAQLNVNNVKFPTITIPNPAAQITNSFVAPANLRTDQVLITSTAEGGDPTFYLGASIVASARAAQSSACAEPNSSDCLSAIAAVLNPGQTVAIQARFALIPLVLMAVVAIISIMIKTFNEPQPQVIHQPYRIIAPTSLVSTLSEVQFGTSVAFKVSTTSGVYLAPLTDTPSFTTGLAEGAVSLSTATTSASGIPSGGIFAVLPSSVPLQQLIPSATGSPVCSVSPGASRLKERSGGSLAIDWTVASNDASGLLWAIADGGPLQALRNSANVVLPQLVPVAKNAIETVIDSGKTLTLLLGAALFNTVALLVLAVAAFQVCISWGLPDWIPIPPQAIDGNPVSASISLSTTTASCPPPSEAPNCNNCGTQTTYTVSSTINLCGGISVMAGKPPTSSLLWESCTCYDPTDFAYPINTAGGMMSMTAMSPSPTGPAPTPSQCTATYRMESVPGSGGKHKRAIVTKSNYCQCAGGVSVSATTTGASTVCETADVLSNTTFTMSTTPTTVSISVMPPTSITSSAALPEGTGSFYIAYIAKQSQYGNLRWSYGDIVYPSVYSTSNPANPNWCSTSFRNVRPLYYATPASPPYPTQSVPISFSGAAPSCTYVPGSPKTSLGYMSCNQAPTSVPCVRVQAPASTCGFIARIQINPDLQCAWQAQATGDSAASASASAASASAASASAASASAASASAASASAASASAASVSAAAATVFNPTSTTTSCGVPFGSARPGVTATAVPRADTSIVADGIAYFCTPQHGPVVLKPGDPLYLTFGLPSPSKIVYQLAFAWDPRAECVSAPAPSLVASEESGGGIGPDYWCSQYFHGLLDGCDAGAGQDKRGGRLFTGCAIYEWMAFLPGNNNVGPVIPWHGSSESLTDSTVYGSTKLDRRDRVGIQERARAGDGGNSWFSRANCTNY